MTGLTTFTRLGPSARWAAPFRLMALTLPAVRLNCRPAGSLPLVGLSSGSGRWVCAAAASAFRSSAVDVDHLLGLGDDPGARGAPG
jgi:hypothetical protein